ncbi:hypothetical protein Tco_0981151, partial [Tanacetum coccineum]
HHTGQGESSPRSRPSRLAISFPSYIHCGYNDHQSDDCNPQHVTKSYETCGSNGHTTIDHNDIERFKKREALQAKKVETLKTSKTESSSALRSKTPTKRYLKGTSSLGLGILNVQVLTKKDAQTLTMLNATWTENALQVPLDEPAFKKLIVELALENSKVSFSVPTGGIYGKVGVNIFRNAIGAHYLPHSSEYVASPSIDIVRLWFEIIRYGETVLAKGSLKKSLFPLRWRLLMAQIIQYLGGTKLGAKPGHKKHSTSLKQPSMSSSEATKGGSSKRTTSSKTGHLKRKKEFSSAMDSNPSQTSASTPVVAEMHKEDQQATGGPTSLGVTSEERANPQLNSAVSTAEADPGKSAPSDFIPQQQDKTQSVSEGLETVLTQPTTGKRANSITRKVEEDEASRTIKLEDLAKLVSSVQPSFKDLDSPEDDPIIVVDDSDEDEEADEVHATTNSEIEDASVPKSSSPRAQPSFPNMGQLNELLVKSLQTEFLKILYTRDFSSSLSTELKELPAKFNELAEEWELLTEFLSVPTQVEVIQAKLKTLDALPSLLHKVTNALNQFAQVIASNKTKDDSVPSAGQISTQPKDKGKKALSLEKAEKESIDSDFGNETHVTGSMVESSRLKKAKVEAAKRKSEVRKEELVNLFGPEVVNKYHNDRRHQGPGLDDHARTFSSLLLAKVDKRNLNPLKQMRNIEQLRQLFVYSNRGRLLGSVPEPFSSSASALQVLRRLGSIFTLVYAADQKLKKAYKVYKAGKRLLYVKRNKAISLGKTTSRVEAEATSQQMLADAEAKIADVKENIERFKKQFQLPHDSSVSIS